MSIARNRASIRIIVGLAALVALAGCKTAPEEQETGEPTGPFASLEKLLPAEGLTDWQPTGKRRVVIGEKTVVPSTPDETSPEYPTLAQSSLADVAPLLAEYHHKVTAMRDYRRAGEGAPSGTATVEVHEMNEAEEAYGLATVLASGDPVEGEWTTGRHTPVSFCIAKSRYVVRVRAEASAGGAELRELAEAVAEKIFGVGKPPSLVEKLPEANRRPGSIRYFHGPQGLRKADATLAAPVEEVLRHVVGDARAVVAVYGDREAAANTIFVVDRFMGTDVPTAEALEAYLDSTPEMKDRVAHCTVGSRFVVGTLNAEEESVQRVLPEIIDRLGG